MHPHGKPSTRGAFGVQRFLVGFCAGAMVLGIPWPAPPALPTWIAATGLGGVALLLAAAFAGRRAGLAARWLTLVGLPLGLAVSGLANHRALEARLHVPASGATVAVTGRVVTDPVPLSGRGGLPAERFEARLASGQGANGPRVAGRRVRLSWYGGSAVARGEVWRWTAVLKGPWGYADPGGFDYERWLLGAGLQGTGYVRRGERLAAARAGAVDRARARLTRLVDGLHLANGGVLLALLIGRGSGIPDALWQVLRATGTVHLMVISGLHVSLAAALGFVIGRWASCLGPWLPLWLNVRAAGCLTGAAAAVAYVTLAGAGLPAVRALLMSAATLTLLLGGRTSRLGGGLLVALAACLSLQPLAVHQQGFWLSFGAVTILYLSLGHRHGEGWLAGLVRAQLGMSLGMLPLVAMSTSTLPWTSVPANLVAVPAMSLVIVPVTLLGGCLAGFWTSAAGGLLTLADAAVGLVLAWLQWLAQAPTALPCGGVLALGVAQAGAVCWLLGVPRVYLPALVLGWALPLAAQPPAPAPGRYRVMALDVGQGTAVSIDTHRHRLLYDAGPAYPGGFETGSAVVVPSLAATGPPRLDMMILSHDDRDHTGGANVVRRRLAPSVVIAPARLRLASERACSPRRWHWDGVSFRLVGVTRPVHPSDNDRSCILLVDDGRHRTLIAGDIGRRVEAGLMEALAPRELPVQVLFAPHHGSATSSSTALVRVLHPGLVMVSAGHGNRFGHPRPEVVERYRRVGARLFQTGRDGALIWTSAAPDDVLRWRSDRGPYWRSREAGGSDSIR